MSRFRFWDRIPVRWRVRLRRLFLLGIAVLLVLSYYQSLQSPSRDAKAAKKAANAVVDKLRADNAKLCDFMRGVDSGLGSVFKAAPTSAAGAAFRGAFIGIQQSARDVAQSSICLPPKGHK